MIHISTIQRPDRSPLMPACRPSVPAKGTQVVPGDLPIAG